MNLITRALNKIFKSGNQQELNKIQPLIASINAMEAEISKLKDGEFRSKTEILKKRLKENSSSSQYHILMHQHKVVTTLFPLVFLL